MDGGRLRGGQDGRARGRRRDGVEPRGSWGGTGVLSGRGQRGSTEIAT